MEEKTSRPISVWVAQIVLSIFGLFFLVFTGFFVLGAIGSLSAGSYRSLPGLLIGSVIMIGFVFIIIMAVVGMAKRENYGRWLGVGVLTFFTVASFMGRFVPKEDRAIQTYEYENQTQATSGFITSVVIFGLLLWLIFILARSDKVNVFFGGESKNDTSILQD